MPIFYDVNMKRFFDADAKEIKPNLFTPIIALMPSEFFCVVHLNETQNDTESFAHALLQLNLDGSKDYYFIRPIPQIGYIYPQSILQQEILNLQNYSIVSLIAIPNVLLLPALIPTSTTTLIVWIGNENFIAVMVENVVHFFQVLKPEDSLALVLANLVPILNFHQLFPQKVFSVCNDSAITDFCATSGIEFVFIDSRLYHAQTIDFINDNPQICWVEDSKIKCKYFNKIILFILLICCIILALPLWEFWGAYQYYHTHIPQKTSEENGVNIDKYYIQSLLIDSDFPLEAIDDLLWHKIYEIIGFETQYFSPLLFDFTNLILSQGVNIQKVEMDYLSKILQLELSAADYGILILTLEKLKQAHSKTIFINQTQNINGYYVVNIGITL